MNEMNITCQNLWNSDKAVLKGKFISVNAYTKKNIYSLINNLNFHPMKLEKIRTS